MLKATRISERECIVVFRRLSEVEGTCRGIFTIVRVEKSEDVLDLLICKLFWN
jgi:hypothetical protein